MNYKNVLAAAAVSALCFVGCSDDDSSKDAENSQEQTQEEQTQEKETCTCKSASEIECVKETETKVTACKDNLVCKDGACTVMTKEEAKESLGSSWREDIACDKPGEKFCMVWNGMTGIISCTNKYQADYTDISKITLCESGCNKDNTACAEGGNEGGSGDNAKPAYLKCTEAGAKACMTIEAIQSTMAVTCGEDLYYDIKTAETCTAGCNKDNTACAEGGNEGGSGDNAKPAYLKCTEAGAKACMTIEAIQSTMAVTCGEDLYYDIKTAETCTAGCNDDNTACAEGGNEGGSGDNTKPAYLKCTEAGAKACMTIEAIHSTMAVTCGEDLYYDIITAETCTAGCNDNNTACAE